MLLLILLAYGVPILARLLFGSRFVFPLGGVRTAAGNPWLEVSKTIRRHPY